MTNKLYTSGTVVDSGSLNDFNTSAYNFLSAIAGTADNITAVGPLSMLSYVTGQKFFFTPTGTNTTNATININGLGGRAITKFGNTLLIAGDLVTGKVAEIVYDGVGFQLINPQTFNLTNTVPAANLTGTVAIANGGTAASTAAQALINLGATGRLLNTQVFTASGTYTPTAGTTRILVRVLGGGGAGGGVPATGAGQAACGGGGGSGGYAEGFFTTGFSPTTPVTVGGGGAGVSAGTGAAGGTTTFLTLSATGGGGGTASVAAATVVCSGGVGGTGSGGYLNARGGNGELAGFNTVNVIFLSGQGADSSFGGGGGKGQTTAGSGVGNAAIGFGSGGGGAVAAASSAAQAGGAGTAGFVIIHEYS